jgi:hypothetical protein
MASFVTLFSNQIPHFRVEQLNHHFHNGKWKELVGDFGNFYFAVFGKYSIGVDNMDVYVTKDYKVI